ncbi:MAG: hypothetical protein ACP5M8_07115 [Caldisphaera sp.]|nr:hypothetical protein [Caldisphaera sp.]
MPIEVESLDELSKFASKAIECRVKRNDKNNEAKIKVRTRKYLYTFKTSLDKVDEILTKLNCKNVVDLEKEKPKKTKKVKEKKKEGREEEVKGKKEENKEEVNVAENQEIKEESNLSNK